MTSSDTYMPDMSEARLAYILGVKEILSRGGYASNSKTLGAEFDRFISHIKAEAWDEGAEAFEAAHRWDNAEPWQYLSDNPYREDENDE